MSEHQKFTMLDSAALKILFDTEEKFLAKYPQPGMLDYDALIQMLEYLALQLHACVPEYKTDFNIIDDHKKLQEKLRELWTRYQEIRAFGKIMIPCDAA